MRVTEAILDLDDFLNDFTCHVLACLGCDVHHSDYDAFPAGVGFNLPLGYAQLTGTPVLLAEDFWPMVDEDIWASTPKSPHFWFLEAAAERLGHKNVRIVTAPVYIEGALAPCLAGKGRWIEEHLPVWAQRRLFIGREKYRFATPHTVLFDDSDTNIREFRRAGGKAQIIPRPWNSGRLSPGATVDQVLESWLGVFDDGRTVCDEGQRDAGQLCVGDGSGRGGGKG